MDESIKCECGNDKFWWFGDYSRCTSCYNEYMFNDSNLEYWVRRFNKEENHYPENWEHFNPQTFQQISDKGLESLSKDESIIENAADHMQKMKDAISGDPVDLDENWIEQNNEFGDLKEKVSYRSIPDNVVKEFPTIALFKRAIHDGNARWLYNHQCSIKHTIEN